MAEQLPSLDELNNALPSSQAESELPSLDELNAGLKKKESTTPTGGEGLRPGFSILGASEKTTSESKPAGAAFMPEGIKPSEETVKVTVTEPQLFDNAQLAEQQKRLKETGTYFQTILPAIDKQRQIKQDLKSNTDAYNNTKKQLTNLDKSLQITQDPQVKQDLLNERQKLEQTNAVLGKKVVDLQQENTKTIEDIDKIGAQFGLNTPKAHDDTSYLGGSLKAFNEGFIENVIKPLEGAEQIVTDLTGINFNPAGTQSWSEAQKKADEALPDMPKGYVGDVLKGTVQMAPMMAATAVFPPIRLEQFAQATGGLITQMPAFTTQMVATNALNKYKDTGSIPEAIKAGEEGAVEGTLMHMLGYSGSKVGEMVSKVANNEVLGGAAGALATGMMFGTNDVINDVANQYLNTGKVEGVDWNRALVSTGTGLAFGLPHLAQIAMSRATDNFNMAPSNVINGVLQSDKTVAELRDEALKKIEEAADMPHGEEKQKTQLAATSLSNLADIKGVAETIVHNPEPFIEDIKKNEDLSEEEKQFYIDKINKVVIDSDPRVQAAAPILNQISDIQKRMDEIEKSNIDPNLKEIQKADAEDKIKELKKKAEEAYRSAPAKVEAKPAAPETALAPVEEVKKEEVVAPGVEVKAEEVKPEEVKPEEVTGGAKPAEVAKPKRASMLEELHAELGTKPEKAEPKKVVAPAAQIVNKENLETLSTEGMDDKQKGVIKDVKNVVKSVTPAAKELVSKEAVDGDTVYVPSDMPGRPLNKMVFDNGEWKEEVNGDLFSTSEARANKAEEMFSKGKDITVHIHTDPKTYSDAVISKGGNTQQAAGSKGFFMSDDGEIHLNMSAVTPDTMLHEGFHPVLDYMAKNRPEIIDSLHKQLGGLQGGKEVIAKAEKAYAGSDETTIKKEAITDYIARVASGDIKIDKTNFQKIRDYVVKMLNQLGLNVGLDINTIEDLQDLARNISIKFKTGGEIKVSKGIIGPEVATEPQFSKEERVSEMLKDDVESKVVAGKTVSTRLPNTGDEHSSNEYKVSLEEQRKSPANYLKNALIIADYDIIGADSKTKSLLKKGLTETRKGGDQKVLEKAMLKADEVYDSFIRKAADNLLSLHDSFDQPIRKVSKRWYDGANVIAQEFAKKYKSTLEQAAAVIAVLSPKKDWYTNVDNAKRILDIYKNHMDFVITKDMMDKYIELSGVVVKKASDTAKQAKEREVKAKQKQEAAKKTAETLIGKKIKDTGEFLPEMVRVYDETYNDPSFDILSPNGKSVGKSKNKPTKAELKKDPNAQGEETKTSWAGYTAVRKALSILKDGSQENISKQLGEAHKVRSFNNNIVDPNSPDGHITADTHAAAAALWKPLAANDTEVAKHMFGGSSDVKTGLIGTYPAMAEAYRLAAKERGILPREMQSITWEAVRGLFTDSFKSGFTKDAKLLEKVGFAPDIIKKATEEKEGIKPKGISNKAVINKIWQNERNGKITIDEARKQITEFAQGVDDPSWTRSNRESSLFEEATPDARELPMASILGTKPGAEPGRVAGGETKMVQPTSKVKKQTPQFAMEEAPKKLATLFNEPLKEAKDVADEYAKEKGMSYAEPEKITSVDKERAKRIADAYEAMDNNPNDPKVKKAYEAMAKETLDQYKSILKRGYEVEINNEEPYDNSKDMISDLRDNKRMRIFSTESGFGAEPITEKQREENPLLRDSGFKDKNGQPLLVNDVFRFVHDFFGHAHLGNGFGPVGEENAWNVHARMYTPEARKAMTTETRGQNSWVNFSGVNDEAFKLRDEARKLRASGDIEGAKKLTNQVYEKMKFADQKIGLLPDEFIKTDDELKAEGKGDKLSNTYYEPHLTESKDGKNYVFFHVTGADAKSLESGIDSRERYSTRTSKEEKAQQYGVASFYTKDTDSERMVGGEKYAVRVPKDKVYPMDSDPNGYRDSAEEKYPEGTSARESKIRKDMAEQAKNDGYEMAVGEWYYDRTGKEAKGPAMRADALVPLKPTEVEYQSAKKAEIEHPEKETLMAKEKGKDLAKKIYDFKNGKNVYDDAYRLAQMAKEDGIKSMNDFDKMTKGLKGDLAKEAEAMRPTVEASLTKPEVKKGKVQFAKEEMLAEQEAKIKSFVDRKIKAGESIEEIKGVLEDYGLSKDKIEELTGGAKVEAKPEVKAEVKIEEIAPKEETVAKFAELTTFDDKLSKTEGSAKRNKIESDRKKWLEENPSMKEIFTNSKDILKQLEAKGIIKFPEEKGPCF